MSTFDATLVIRNIDNERFQALMEANPDWSAMARFDAISEKDQLADFVRGVARGDFDDPAEAASDLMDEMGWA